MNERFYTGVGSRKTPHNILNLMADISEYLEYWSYFLRSGGAKGADSAFASRAHFAQIFRPHHCTPEAMAIAQRFHPAWDRCGDYARRLHGRNAFQVLGFDLKTPSQFLICWTPDACISHAQRSIRTGGTGTAISIADYYGVKIWNLARSDHAEYWSSRILDY